MQDRRVRGQSHRHMTDGEGRNRPAEIIIPCLCGDKGPHASGGRERRRGVIVSLGDRSHQMKGSFSCRAGRPVRYATALAWWHRNASRSEVDGHNHGCRAVGCEH